MTSDFNPAADLGMADWARMAVARGEVGDHLPAKSVTVIKTCRAECDLPGCEWTGTRLPDYQAANDERQRHLDRHRAALAWARGGSS